MSLPFNPAWLITVVGFVIGLGVWARSKRILPAVGVFLGGILIMALADPTTLTQLGQLTRTLINDSLSKALNTGG